MRGPSFSYCGFSASRSWPFSIVRLMSTRRSSEALLEVGVDGECVLLFGFREWTEVYPRIEGVGRLAIPSLLVGEGEEA